MGKSQVYDTCCICGSEYGKVCTSLANNMRYYCDECISKGLEIYEDLVSFGIYYSEYNSSYKSEILNPSLAYYHKTAEEFNSDVDKMLNKKEDNKEDEGKEDGDEEIKQEDDPGNERRDVSLPTEQEEIS